MQHLFFYLFSFLAVLGGVMLVCFRNPVSSAMSMVLSFVGMAGLFILLNAYFVGIIQILVYAGAVMVLFVFIIMLLDVDDESKVKFRSSTIFVGMAIPILLFVQVIGVVQMGPTGEEAKFQPITKETMAESAQEFKEDSAIYRSLTHPDSPKLPDTNLIGETIFRGYNFPLQVIGVLLLVATIGVVVLSKRSKHGPQTES